MASHNFQEYLKKENVENLLTGTNNELENIIKESRILELQMAVDRILDDSFVIIQG
jgi:hypothetical protein